MTYKLTSKDLFFFFPKIFSMTTRRRRQNPGIWTFNGCTVGTYSRYPSGIIAWIDQLSNKTQSDCLTVGLCVRECTVADYYKYWKKAPFRRDWRYGNIRSLTLPSFLPSDRSKRNNAFLAGYFPIFFTSTCSVNYLQTIPARLLTNLTDEKRTMSGEPTQRMKTHDGWVDTSGDARYVRARAVATAATAATRHSSDALRHQLTRLLALRPYRHLQHHRPRRALLHRQLRSHQHRHLPDKHAR